METILEKIRSTNDNKILGVIRIMLGAQFFATGIMKFFDPWRGNWIQQLTQANIPFYTFSLWLGPIVEIFMGLLLVAGFFSRVAGLIGVVFMMVAIYAHFVVDPNFLPFGNVTTYHIVAPLVVLAMSVYVLWRGGGAWSRDLGSETKINKND